MSPSLRTFSDMALPDQFLTHTDDEWNLKYRSYLLLAFQQDQLRQRLSLTVPSACPLQEGTSSLSSPDEGSIYPSHFYNHNNPLSPISSHPLPPFAENDKSEEDRLFDINRQIKATLTELLNHPDVRQDPRFASWVKERLMDVAHERRELRKLRCGRRSSTGSEDEFGFGH